MGIQGGPTFDHERVSFNLARLRKGGETFEIVVDPDAAILLKETGKGDVNDVVKAQKVFSDAKKGLLASEEHMQAVFGTDDFKQVAQRVLADGEIQLTTEYRDKVREQKRRKLLLMIRRNAVDPKTGLPHPEKRIELAFEEAKVKMDEFRTVEQQMNDVVRKLQPVLPLKFETAHLSIKLPVHYAGKLRGEIARIGKVTQERWLPNGDWEGTVELPAGMKMELIDLLNNETHGGATVEEKE